MVRRARSKVFHIHCFTCLICKKKLATGEELYILDDNRFICKEDFVNSRHHQSGMFGHFCLSARAHFPENIHFPFPSNEIVATSATRSPCLLCTVSTSSNTPDNMIPALVCLSPSSLCSVHVCLVVPLGRFFFITTPAAFASFLSHCVPMYVCGKRR